MVQFCPPYQPQESIVAFFVIHIDDNKPDFPFIYPGRAEVATDLPLIQYSFHTPLFRSVEECITSYIEWA